VVSVVEKTWFPEVVMMTVVTATVDELTKVDVADGLLVLVLLVGGVVAGVVGVVVGVGVGVGVVSGTVGVVGVVGVVTGGTVGVVVVVMTEVVVWPALVRVVVVVTPVPWRLFKNSSSSLSPM
jgi:hypothetical protein